MNSQDRRARRTPASQGAARTEAAAWPVRAAAQLCRRFGRAAILSSAADMLERANINDLSLSGIADLQLKLARTYDAQLPVFLGDSESRRHQMRRPTWRERVRLETSIAREFFNARRPACGAILGPLLHRRNRGSLLIHVLPAVRTDRRCELRERPACDHGLSAHVSAGCHDHARNGRLLRLGGQVRCDRQRRMKMPPPAATGTAA